MRSKISNRTVAAITVLIVALIAAESFVRALIRQIYSIFYVSITILQFIYQREYVQSRGLSNKVIRSLGNVLCLCTRKSANK